MLKKAFTIAASDPSGGAGIEADLKVFAAHGVFGMSAITGITIQGPRGIEKMVKTPAADFGRILQIISRQIKPDAVKIGALASRAHIKLVGKFLEEIKRPSVFDPVLRSGRGFWLVERKALHDVISLFPLVDLITPNIPEAEMLTGMRLRNQNDMIKIVQALTEKGARAILLKGGHMASAPVDIFFQGNKVRAFRKKRLAGRFHGTGCALASAIAANLALGIGIEDAVAGAEVYIEKVMRKAVDIKGVKYLTHIF
jgi:hydroxymethylpyrimidine/phosphomethylpyrimidine kinase